MLWELVFMLVVLKIPVVYLCAVVWWAIRAEPRPLEGVGAGASLDPDPVCDWRTRRVATSRNRRTPRGGGRSGGRPGRVAHARARAGA